MKIKEYFDVEMRTTIIMALMGIISGYLSFMLNSASMAFAAMVVIGAVSAFGLSKILKIKEEVKWWFGNGLIVYIFVWLVVWTIFYNVGLR